MSATPLSRHGDGSPGLYRDGTPDPARAYLASLARTGRRTQRTALRKAAAFFGAADYRAVRWHLLTAQQITDLREHLVATTAPAYGNRILVAVKRVLRECWRAGLLDADALARRCDVRAIPLRDDVPGRMLDDAEQRALRTASSSRGPRDAAIVAVLLGAGLRAAELLHVVPHDLTDDGLDVRGKGGVRRLVPLPAWARAALLTYTSTRGDRPGRLFPLSPRGLAHILGQIGETAGVPHFTRHDCRRTWISTLLDRGADLAVVARMAGHASVRTVARYDRRPMAACRRAASLLEDDASEPRER